MMKKLFTLMLFTSTFFALSLSAQVEWCGKSYMFVRKGGTTTWYTGSNSYIQPGGKFQGANLGNVTDNFILGGRLEVYKPQTTIAKMAYQIDGGSTVDIEMPYKAASGNNSKHEGEGTVSIAGLAPGTHTIAVWFRHTASGASVYDSNNSANYIATFTIVATTPTITLTAPASVFVDETITLSATAGNVTNPVITYSVKVPGSDSFVAATSPYQPTVTGTYTFKAEVSESGDPAVLATDTKNVEVKVVPDPIVIKVQRDIDWGNKVYIFVWGTKSDGFKEMVWDKPTGWYVYTFNREEKVNFLFANVDDFEAEGKKQTADITNVGVSNCYRIYEEDGSVKSTERDCSGVFTNASLNNTKDNHITISKNQLSVMLNDIAEIELYSISGQLLQKVTVNKQFTQNLHTGVYILRVDGETHKVVVR